MNQANSEKSKNESMTPAIPGAAVSPALKSGAVEHPDLKDQAEAKSGTAFSFKGLDDPQILQSAQKLHKAIGL